MRTGQVLEHLPPDPANRLTPPVGGQTLGGPHAVRRGSVAHVGFGDSALRACPRDGCEIDAELLGKLADERRRTHLAVLRSLLPAVRPDDDEHRADRHDRTLGDEDLRNDSGGR